LIDMILANKIPKLNAKQIKLFWSKVDKKEKNECWLWRGATRSRGYGVFYIYGDYYKAHRISWSLLHGKDFPLNLSGCHTCDTPICVNPFHIFAGTMTDNIKDAVRKKGSYHQ